MIAHKSTTVLGPREKIHFSPAIPEHQLLLSVRRKHPNHAISAEERAVVDEVSPCSVNTHLALPCPPAWS